MQGEVHVLGPGLVSQEEIGALVGIQNQMRTLGKTFERRCRDVFARLARGALVECGTHTAELEEIDEGSIRTTRLVLR